MPVNRVLSVGGSKLIIYSQHPDNCKNLAAGGTHIDLGFCRRYPRGELSIALPLLLEPQTATSQARIKLPLQNAGVFTNVLVHYITAVLKVEAYDNIDGRKTVITNNILICGGTLYIDESRQVLQDKYPYSLGK